MAHFANLAYGLIRTPPTPPESGTELVLEAGHGDRLPPVPFDATIWPVTVMPDPTTAEIVTVTARLADTLTIVRAQQGTLARTIIATDQLAGTITKAYLDVVPLVTDPSVTFQGGVAVNGQLTSNGLLVSLGGMHIFNGSILDGPTAINGATTITGGLAVSAGVSCTDVYAAGIVISPQLRGYSETAQFVTVAGGIIALDYAAGNHHVVSLTENITGLTISSVPPYGTVSTVMLYYVASGGPRTVVHTINGHAVRFAQSTPPVMATVAGYIDRVLYTCWDGGIVWLGDIIGTNY